jgi:hypothetical protein
MPVKKLPRSIESRREELATRAAEAADALKGAIVAYNEGATDLFAPVAAALAEYNGAVQDAESLRGEAAQAVREYVDGRSDAWREGDRGQAYEAWVDELEGLDLAEVEVDMPEPVEEPDLGLGDVRSGDWKSEPDI